MDAKKIDKCGIRLEMKRLCDKINDFENKKGYLKKDINATRLAQALEQITNICHGYPFAQGQGLYELHK